MTSAFDETIEYLEAVIGGRPKVTWFTDSAAGDDHVAGPVDVFVETTDGAITWGWSMAPLPIDTGERSFRRFRAPDGLVMLVDADEPDAVFLPHAVDLHSVSVDGHTRSAWALPTGSVPPTPVAFDIEKAARGGRYGIEPAFEHAAISRALSLWVEALLGATVEFEWVAATTGQLDEIDQLADAEGSETGEWSGFDDEITDLVGSFEAIAWTQGDLTWPDADNVEAFRDHVDVVFRAQTGLVFLAGVDPVGAATIPARAELADGSLVVFDQADPTRIGLLPDRLVLALNRPSDGFEPAGLAVPWGTPPSSDQWSELRRFQSEYPDSVLIATPGWSEGRIDAALAAWAEWWGNASVEFGYDYEDQLPQAAISRNEDLADAPVAEERFVRTATTDRCTHTEPASAPHEDPLPCGRRATHYYAPAGSTEGVVVVCEAHIPNGVNASPLLK